MPLQSVMASWVTGVRVRGMVVVVCELCYGET